MHELPRYLERIGFSGDPRPDLATLEEIVRCHVATFPFEALDVQLGRPPSLEPDRIRDKLVGQLRGGWCYEQNGLLGEILRRIGFSVTRLSAAVMREVRGAGSHGTHLALRVDLGKPYLVDVGFGGSLTRPIPLEVGEWTDGPFRIRLTKLDDGWWRFTEQLGHAEPFSFDFLNEPADEEELARLCAWQGTAPGSQFVLNLIAQRRDGDAQRTLRGRVLTETDTRGVQRRVLADADDLVATIREKFGLDLLETASLWPRICARHEEIFGEKAA